MSLPKLMALNPETIDMSKIEMAVRVQDNVGLQKGSAAVSVSMTHPKTGESLSHALVLEKPDDSLTRYLTRQNKSGYKIHRFKMTDEQAEAARVFRKEALAMKAASSEKMDMSLSARVLFCQYKNMPAYENVTMKFYVKTNPKKDFFTLFKEQKLKFDAKTKRVMKEKPIYCED